MDGSGMGREAGFSAPQNETQNSLHATTDREKAISMSSQTAPVEMTILIYVEENRQRQQQKADIGSVEFQVGWIENER